MAFSKETPRQDSPRFRLVATVHIVLRQGDQILLLRRSHTGWGDGLWSLPAGHLDGGEPVRQAAAREALEECGIVIPVTPETLAVVGVMHRRSDREQIDFFLEAQTYEGVPFNREPHKCDGMTWFPEAALPPNMVPYVRHALTVPAPTPWFIEYGWD